MLKQNIKKLQQKNIEDDLNEYVLDPLDDSFVYEKVTSTKEIKNDNPEQNSNF